MHVEAVDFRCLNYASDSLGAMVPDISCFSGFQMALFFEALQPQVHIPANTFTASDACFQ
ncbi:hypothetical protein AQJ23_40690 [Streptomyces antibioticus]|nr:hypothetical protein AQJ23_40690 [Streptomyces antibioticus]